MKALVLQASASIHLMDVATPEPSLDEALVHVAAVGVCGSDVSFVRDPGSSSLPMILGHEFGGRLKDGTQVVVNPMLGCTSCELCRAGNTHLCSRLRVLGFHQAGAYAQEVAVPVRNLVAAPSLSALQCSLVEPIATGLHAWVRAGRPMFDVAIIGAGAIGMCLLHVLNQAGVVGITVIDPIRERLDHALADGATAVAARLTGAHQAVFEAAGTPGTREDALLCTVPGGTVTLIGLHGDRVSLPARPFLLGDRTVYGCFAYSEDEFRQAVRIAASIKAPWSEMISLADAEVEFAARLAGQGPPGRVKTVICPNPT
ncbi:MAG: alcohol dehydrogenase catalytic domain-containing protein [Devosia sp.]